jgi:hypothetical protein
MKFGDFGIQRKAKTLLNYLINVVYLSILRCAIEIASGDFFIILVNTYRSVYGLQRYS